MTTKDKFLRGAELIPSKRWCSQCNSIRVTLDGEWILIENGKRRRWRCADCTNRMKEREKLK
jgi:molybdenum cofactor biosynthesis enzyme MoaA